MVLLNDLEKTVYNSHNNKNPKILAFPLFHILLLVCCISHIIQWKMTLEIQAEVFSNFFDIPTAHKIQMWLISLPTNFRCNTSLYSHNLDVKFWLTIHPPLESNGSRCSKLINQMWESPPDLSFCEPWPLMTELPDIDNLIIDKSKYPQYTIWSSYTGIKYSILI